MLKEPTRLFFLSWLWAKKNYKEDTKQAISKEKLTTYGCFLFLEIAWYAISGFLYFSKQNEKQDITYRGWRYLIFSYILSGVFCG